MFGKRISELRTEKSMTQTELAKKIGISRSALALYETEKREPNIEILIKLAKCFDVQVDYIIGNTDNYYSNNDIEWKYSPVSNRLGNILKNYRHKKKLSKQLFSEKLNITAETYIGIEIGKYTPSLELLKKISEVTEYKIDYLTGAINYISIPTNKTIKINGNDFPIYDSESEYHFRTRFEELCQSKEIDQDNIANFLGLSNSDYIDIRWNRMPTLSELLKISYAFGVSMDYLIGKTDIRLSNLNKDELDLILNYRDCLPHYKKNICERAKELSLESITEKNIESVVADEQTVLKRTGTTNLTK